MFKLTDEKKRIIKILLIIIFLIYVFSLCFSWSVTMDYDTGPDEHMKYDVCRYIFENKNLPHGGDESIRDPIWGLSYAFTPILSYIFSAIFMIITSVFTNNSTILLIAARFVSVLCITAYAFMCIKISDKLFKGIYKWMFVAFCTLLPQMVFLGSYINNDSLALFSIGIIIYSWIIGMKTNWNWKSCIIMAVGLAICSLSYYNAYGYILSSIIIYIASCAMKKMNIKEFFKKGLIITLVALLLAGWWFIRNYLLYDGDFLGMNTSREYGEMYAEEPYKPSNRSTPANTGTNLSTMLFENKWIETTKLSFIGVFGYMEFYMDKNIYNAYEIVMKIGIFGIFIGLIISIIKTKKKCYDNKKDKISNEKILFNLIMLLNIIIPIILSIYYSYFNDFQPQGRYIMPMIIPFMYFIVLGFKNIFDFIKNNKIKNILLSIIILIWSIAPIYIYFEYIKKFL